MGTLITHWVNFIPSEVILGVARESHDATHEVNTMDLGARFPLQAAQASKLLCKLTPPNRSLYPSAISTARPSPQAKTWSSESWCSIYKVSKHY